jgi:hypothetical protein
MPTDKFGNLITDAESLKQRAAQVDVLGTKAHDQTTSYESLKGRAEQAIKERSISAAVTDEFGNRYFRNVAVVGNMSPFAEIAKGAKNLGSQIDNGVQLFVLNLKFAKAQLIFAKGLVDPLVLLLSAAADALIDALEDLLGVGFYHIYIWPWEHGEKTDPFDFNLDQAFWYLYMISQGAPIGLDEREFLDKGDTAFDTEKGAFFTADRDNVKNPYFMKVLDDFNFSSYPKLEEKMAEYTINFYKKTPYSVMGEEARAYYTKATQESIDVGDFSVKDRKAKLEQWAGNAGNNISEGWSEDPASFSLENFMYIMSRDPAVMIEKHIPAQWGLKISATEEDEENVQEASLMSMDGKMSNLLRSLDKAVIPGIPRLTPSQILNKLAASIDDTADPNRPVGTGKFSAVVFLLALPNPSTFNETLESIYSFFGGGLIGGKIKKGIDYFNSNSDVGKTLKIKLHAAAEEEGGIQWLGVGKPKDDKDRDFISLRVPDFVKKKTDRWVNKKNKWQKAWRVLPGAESVAGSFARGSSEELPEPHLVFPFIRTIRDPDSWFGRYTGDKVCQGDFIPWFEADVVSHNLYKNESVYQEALKFEEKGKFTDAQDLVEKWSDYDSVEKYKKFLAAGGQNILTVANMSGNLKLGGKTPIRATNPYNDLGGTIVDLSNPQLKYFGDRKEFAASGGEFGDAESQATYEAGKITMKEFELKTYEQAWFVNDMTEVANGKPVIGGSPPNWSDKVLVQTIFPPYGEAIQRCIEFVQQAKGLLEDPFQFIDDMIKYLEDMIKEVTKLNNQIQRILKLIADGLPAVGLYQLVLLNEEGGAEGFQKIIRSAKFFDHTGAPFNGTGDPSGLDGLEYSMAICFYGQGPDSGYVEEFSKMLGLARSQASVIQKAAAKALQPGVALNLEQPEIAKILIGHLSSGDESGGKTRTDRGYWGGWSQILASGVNIDGGTDIDPTSIIFMEFSEPMDEESIRKAVSVYRPPIRSTDNITNVPGSLFITLNDNERMFLWVPTVEFEEEMYSIFKFDPNDVPLLSSEIAKAKGKDINGADVAYNVPVEDVSFTSANPAVITSSSHGLSTSDLITITKSPEASALAVRDDGYIITKIDDDSFSVLVDASSEDVDALVLSYTFSSTYAAQGVPTPDEKVGESPDNNFKGLSQSIHSIADVLNEPNFKSVHDMLSSVDRKESSTHFFRIEDFSEIDIKTKLRPPKYDDSGVLTGEGDTIVVRNPKSNDLAIGVSVTEYGEKEDGTQSDAGAVYGTAIVTEIIVISNSKQYVFLDRPISGFSGIGHKLSDGTTTGACVRITNQNYRLKISTEASDQNENRLGALNQLAQPNNIEKDYVTETGFTIRSLTGN